MKNNPTRQQVLTLNEMQSKNQYPDNTSKRLHLKGIEAAQNYLNRKRKFIR